MTDIAPAVATFVELLTAVAFLFVGTGLFHYPTSPQARPALLFFSGYWGALGASIIVQFLILLISAGWPGDFLLLGQFLFLLAHAVSLLGVSGFMFFLTYILTGQGRTSWIVFGGFGVFGIVQLFLASMEGTIGRAVSFRAPFYASVQSALVPYEIAFLITLTPFFFGSLGLIVLGLRSRRIRTQYRALLVGGSLLAWFGASATEYAIHWKGLGELAPSLVAFGAAMAVYLAYYPPPFIERRLDEIDAYQRTQRAPPMEFRDMGPAPPS